MGSYFTGAYIATAFDLSSVGGATGAFLTDPYKDETQINNCYEFVQDSTKTFEDITLKVNDLFKLTPSSGAPPPGGLKPKTLFPSLKVDRDLFHTLYDQKKGNKVWTSSL